MKVFFSLLFALSLSACLKVTDIPKDEEAQPFSAQVLEMENPGQYKVLLPAAEGMQILHRHMKDSKDSLSALPMKMQDGVLTDDQVEAGKTYVYESGVNKDGNFEVLQSFEITIPQDLLINGELALTKDEYFSQYRRIFFAPGSILTTNGHQLVIQADQLYSTDATVRTFAPGAQAAAGVVGLSGGTIQIFLRTGRGPFKFEMRGQRGGRGKDGDSATAEPIQLPNGGDFGHGGPIDGRINFLKIGSSGGRGQDGMLGGSSGRVEITISALHELIFQPTFEPGQGGEGGNGGAGQPIGGSVDQVGTSGSNGAPGPSGFKDQLCVHDLKGQVCW